ncbi:MAG TPA: polysaccharide biosynthesis tyrosine autokinase [Caulobacteraceae bacterium]|jgi:capsular exopolysaccharide synthesis family protein
MRNDDDQATDPIHLPAPRRPLQLNRLNDRQLMVDLRGDEAQGEGGGSTFLDYWHILVKWRWVIGAMVVAAVALSVAISLLMTPIYRATGVIQIDMEAPKVVDVDPQRQEARQEQNADQFYQTQYGLLKSRALAERVVNKLNLASNASYLISGSPVLGFLHVRAQFDSPLNQTFDYRHRLAVRKFMDHIKVTPVRGSRLVKISYDSIDPKLAALIVNTTADEYIASSLDQRFQASSYARQFLEDHLADQKQKLEASERALVQYATAQHIVNIGAPSAGADGKTSSDGQSLDAASLSALNESLAQAKGARILAEQRWKSANSTQVMALPDVLGNPAVQALQARKAQLESDYQDKLKIYKPDFPAMTQIRAQIDETDKQIAAQVANIKESLHEQYEVAQHQEASLGGQVSGLTSSVLNLKNRSIEYDTLQREVDTNQQLYDGLLQQFKAISVAGNVVANNIFKIDTAIVPSHPSQPRPLLNVLAALGAGLVLGVLLAFGLEYLDDSIKVPEDVESKLGIPLLGSIPVLEKGVGAKEALADGRSALSEAYYSVRTALQFSTDTGVPKSFLVTSARPSEGKSTTALALAQNFARLGMRVLLIDGDLRNPSLHHYVSCDNTAGLSNYLIGASSLFDVVQATDRQNLFLMPCGPLPPNPAELLASGKVRGLLAKADEQFDLVVIDGPPIMGLADAPLLASVTAGTVMVIEAGTTRRGLARAAVRRLLTGQAHLLGAVLNKFSLRKAGYGYAYGYGYSYAYSYGYGANEPRIESKRK